MKIIKCTPDGDERNLEEEISSLLHKYFPVISLMENESKQNMFMEKECNDDKMKISLSFSYLMPNKLNEIKNKEMITKISLQVEKPEERVNSEIFFG